MWKMMNKYILIYILYAYLFHKPHNFLPLQKLFLMFIIN